MIPGVTSLLVAMSQDRGVTEAGKATLEAMFRDPVVANAIIEQSGDLNEAFAFGKAYADVVKSISEGLRHETIVEIGQRISVALDRLGNEVYRKKLGPVKKPNLTLTTIEQNGRLVQLGTNPKSGKVETREDIGAVPPPDLQFKFVRDKKGAFLIGLNPNTGEELFRKESAPVRQRQEVTPGPRSQQYRD